MSKKIKELTIEEFTMLFRKQIKEAQKRIEVKEEKLYVSKESAAKLIDVKVSTIESYIKQGDLKPYYIRGKNSLRLIKADVLGLVKGELNNTAKTVKIGRIKRGLVNLK